jgi:hypothetical protein
MALPVLKYNVGDSKTLRFQLREADKITPVNIAGLTFTFYARDKAGDAAYTISPVTATITDAANGRFEFDVLMPATATNSLYWITREDGDIDTFEPAEGTEIRILDK